MSEYEFYQKYDILLASIARERPVFMDDLDAVLADSWRRGWEETERGDIADSDNKC